MEFGETRDEEHDRADDLPGQPPPLEGVHDARERDRAGRHRDRGRGQEHRELVREELGGCAQASEKGELVGRRPARHERAEDAHAHDGEDEEDARVDDLADRALIRADRDDEEDQEVREEGHRGGELEDAPVRARGDDVLLLRELHTVRDELGPAVEAARVHRAEPALHVGHHLVFGLTDDQGERQEHDEDDEEA